MTVTLDLDLEIPHMTTGTITVSKTSANLPASNATGPNTTTVVLTDAAGAAQSFSLNGSETPPWSVSVSNIAVGTGQIVVSDIDSAGSQIGSSTTTPFTTVDMAGGPPPATFQQSSSVSFTQTA